MAWLDGLRANAMDRFAELARLQVKDEWKYTNVAPIASRRLQTGALQTAAESELEAEALARFRCVETAQSELVFLERYFAEMTFPR